MILDFILCNGVGLSLVDKNLTGIIDAMNGATPLGINGYIASISKVVGYCIALGLGSYECWMMILGKRGMDVMKLLYIVIISICISLSSQIVSMIDAPCQGLTNLAKEQAIAQTVKLDEREEAVAKARTKYFAALDTALSKKMAAKEIDNKGEKEESDGMFSGITDTINEKIESVKNWFHQVLITIETKITEWIAMIIRFIGEILFQSCFYGMIVASIIFRHILAAFAPLMFAISLAPPFRSAWSQWLSKYISISLWGFVVYSIFYYITFLMDYNLGLDEKMYISMIATAESNTTGGDLATFGIAGLGTTIMYVVSLMIGVFCLQFVPEVASWLIPGGVSSGAGSMSSTTSRSIGQGTSKAGRMIKR